MVARCCLQIPAAAADRQACFYPLQLRYLHPTAVGTPQVKPPPGPHLWCGTISMRRRCAVNVPQRRTDRKKASRQPYWSYAEYTIHGYGDGRNRPLLLQLGFQALLTLVNLLS